MDLCVRSARPLVLIVLILLVGAATALDARSPSNPGGRKFMLTTMTAGNGQGTVTGAGKYPSGTVVTVGQSPAAGSTFVGWSGACTGTGACVVTMDANKTVTATFTKVTTMGIINAASTSRADVGTAVASATHGDTVIMPSGDSTWTTQLDIAVGITLQGSGEGTTIIRDNVTKDGSSTSSLMKFTVNTPNNFRITNFTVVGVATDPSIFNKGHFVLDGTAKAFRFDHITATNPQTSLIRTYGYLWGVIDHVTMPDTFVYLLQAGHDTWGGSDYGDGSWAEALYLGTEKAIYVEDCVLTAGDQAAAYNMTDGLAGARVVIRHNTFNYGRVASHGAEGGGRTRGHRSMEVYENDFYYSDSAAWVNDNAMQIRGGTGVFFNNRVHGLFSTFGNFNYVVKHQNYRDGFSDAPWGKCDGTGPYDENSGGGTGYRCVDQPGSGTSVDLGGNLTPVQVLNSLDPVYVWGNEVNGVADNCGGANGCLDDGHVVAGRDIIFGTARPGYTPYSYPHPLTGSGPPAVPTGVSVVEIP
jgi:uncharacterized repeat protein (TIGR02543 family)